MILCPHPRRLHVDFRFRAQRAGGKSHADINIDKICRIDRLADGMRSIKPLHPL
jgi:hypothetical protein